MTDIPSISLDEFDGMWEPGDWAHCAPSEEAVELILEEGFQGELSDLDLEEFWPFWFLALPSAAQEILSDHEELYWWDPDDSPEQQRMWAWNADSPSEDLLEDLRKLWDKSFGHGTLIWIWEYLPEEIFMESPCFFVEEPPKTKLMFDRGDGAAAYWVPSKRIAPEYFTLVGRII